MMINHQRTPANLLSYANNYALPSARRVLHPPAPPPPPAPPMFSSGYVGMPSMHMYAQPEYQQHMHVANALQQQQQTTAAPAGYHPSSFRHFQQHHPLSHLPRGTHQPQPQQQQHRIRHFNGNMAYTPQMSSDDLAEMQKLSEGWQPEIKGPLVSERLPSTAIAEEYATADPIYQQKTAALPKRFSHYRTVRGDGRCGWRAIGFAFLERLITSNNAVSRLVEQEARLRSLNNIINAAGYPLMAWEDFADALWELMRKLGEASKSGNADAVLLEAFNDEGVSTSVITHLRTLTASWMKTRPEEYVNFIPSLNVDHYVDTVVMPYQAEIDNVALSALNDVLLDPADITLDVLYLDLSDGNEADLHSFARRNLIMYKESISLLYRPGHYDILYKPEDIPQPPVATYLQFASNTYNDPVFDIPANDFMTMVPGMSLAGRQHGWISSNTYSGGCDFFPAPTPAQPCLSSILPSPVSTTPMLPQQSSYGHQQTSLSLLPHHMPSTQELPIRSAPPHSLTTPFQPVTIAPSGGPFRPSHWELEADVAQATSQVPLQTSIFRNSHFNTAHFLNPDFQPEEWSPDNEYVTSGSRSSKRGQSG